MFLPTTLSCPPAPALYLNISLLCACFIPRQKIIHYHTVTGTECLSFSWVYMLKLNEQLVHGSLHSLRFSCSVFWKLLSHTSPWVTTRFGLLFLQLHAQEWSYFLEEEPASFSTGDAMPFSSLSFFVQRQHQEKLFPLSGVAKLLR